MRARLHRLARVVLTAGIITAMLWVLPRLEQLDNEQLTAWLQTFGPFAPILFVAARTAGSVVFVPGSLMAFAAGMLFGPVWGAAYNLVASTAGALAAFGIARYLAPAWVADHIGSRERLRRLAEGIRANGWKFVAFVRMVPLFPYNVVNYAFGLTPVRFFDYAWASAVFMIPADVAYVYLGFAGREALSGNDHAWALALGAFGVLACLATIPGVYKLYSNRRLRAAPD
jgi:uncharacterized membrane protein YdjX (TVP38/TMEM64 family)